MRIRIFILCTAIVLLSQEAECVTDVRAFADINVYHVDACNELDIEGSHQALLVDLDLSDAGYPLGVWGEIRACGFLGFLFKECHQSLNNAVKGSIATCVTYHHTAKCNKEYKTRTDAFYGNEWWGIGDVQHSGCDSEECIIPDY